MSHLRTRLIVWLMFILFFPIAFLIGFVESVPHWLRWLIFWVAIILTPGLAELFGRREDLDTEYEKARSDFEVYRKKSAAALEESVNRNADSESAH